MLNAFYAILALFTIAKIKIIIQTANQRERLFAVYTFF